MKKLYLFSVSFTCLSIISIGQTAVVGLSTEGTGVLGSSPNGIGVHGHSLNDSGVLGTSTGSNGVRGESTFGHGVDGLSSKSFGVYGKSESAIGVFGVSISADGVTGISDSLSGIMGRSLISYGVEGNSLNGHGAYFRGKLSGGFADIVLGGSDYFGGVDDGVIMSDPSKSGSDLFLVSNDAVIIEMDNNADEAGSFEVWDDADDRVLAVFETGRFEIWNPTVNNRRLELQPDGDLFIDGTLTQGSDRNRKENIVDVDPSEILAKLVSIPISRWNYKEDPTPHLGPMAQDFYAAFDVGVDETGISAIDADGVSMAAIIALYEQNSKQQSRIDQLEKRISEMDDLKQEIGQLSKVISEQSK